MILIASPVPVLKTQEKASMMINLSEKNMYPAIKGKTTPGVIS